MSYTTLVGDVSVEGSIKYWINYTRIDSAGILTEAQAWIYARLRVLDMLETGDVAIASAATSAAFPTGYQDAVHLGIPGYVNSIKFTDAGRFRAILALDQDGVLPEAPPTRWTKINQQIAFNSMADRAYTAKMAFFKTPAALADDNDTNWLTEKYPTLLRRVCLMFAAEARKEFDSMDRAEIRAIETIDQIKVESDLGMRGMELDFNWEGNE